MSHDVRKLDANHVEALVRHSVAHDALRELLAAADTYVGERWGARSNEGWFAGGHYSVYSTGLPLDRGFADDFEGFSWDLLYDAARWFPDMKRGLPVFTAGIRRREWMSDASDRVLTEHGFALFSRERGNWQGNAPTRIYRRVALDDVDLNLLGRETLEHQGLALGSWLERAFADLRTALSTADVQEEFRTSV